MSMVKYPCTRLTSGRTTDLQSKAETAFPNQAPWGNRLPLLCCSVTQGDQYADMLMLPGGVNSLLAEILEDQHMTHARRGAESPQERKKI